MVVAMGGALFRLSRDQFVPYPFKDDKKPPFYWIRNLFTAPEYRTVTIAKLATDDVTKDITISDLICLL